MDIKANRAIVVVPPSRGRRWANPEGEVVATPKPLMTRRDDHQTSRGPDLDVTEINLAPVEDGTTRPCRSAKRLVRRS